MSCFGDTTGPRHGHRAPLAIAPVFDRLAVQLVPFDRVRLHLIRPGSGDVVEDTVVSFPSTADTVAVGVTVPLQGPSETFSLTLAMITAGGDTVFRGGPTSVTLQAGAENPAVSNIPTYYVGVGFNAAGVRFKAPVPATAFFGDTAVMAAEAYDSSGQAIPGTPILYGVAAGDTSKAVVPNPDSDRVVVRAQRGPAHVVATLLTHQTATTTLVVQPLPSAVSVTGGSAQSATVGTALPQPVVVRVKAADSLGVQGISVSFAVTSGGGTLTASSGTTDSLGYASVGWTLGHGAGVETVSATVAGLTPAPITATGTAAAPAQLVYAVSPGNTAAGAVIAPAVQVAARDSFGNAATAYTGNVTVALGANPGSATLGGTLTVAAVAGVATFTDLTLNRIALGYTIAASATGLRGVTSAPFNVAAGAAATLALVSGNNQSGAPSTLLPQPIVVKVTDALGNPVSGHSVTFAATSGGGSVGTPNAVTDSTGSASSTWTLGATGVQTASVTATGLAGSPLTITIATAATTLALVSGNSQIGSPGTLLPQPIVVKVTDAFGTGVSGHNVTFAVTSGGGSVGTPNAVTDATGSASSTWTLGTSGVQSVSVTATGLAGSPLTITTGAAGTASRVTFTVQPANAAAGAAIAPAVQVAAEDPFGTVVTTFTGPIAIALGTNPGAATLSGTLSVNAVAGVATFADLKLNRPASGYTLAASATSLNGATSSTFNVTAGAAKTLSLVSGNNQNGTLGAVLPLPIVVKVTDSLGNGVPGFGVAFAVASGGGSVGTPSATTDTTGSASSTWTLGPSGVQALTVTATGLAGSPLSISAITASTTVTPHLDTLTSLGDTIRLAAQAKNSLGQNITGSFTWLSRGPAVATVTTLGTVTAVTNGSTWVVATEAGGSTDSALIVVQQKLVSISVSPASKSIYVGASYKFTASGVDGLGHQIATPLTFTWASTAPAVASVDTAGNVSGLWLGAAQIKATSGAVTGVASVTILTQITKLLVVVDTVGATKTDTFSLASLGVTRRYRALAYDTLSNLMTLPDTSYHWTSSNPSVAALPNVASDTISATSVANGVTSIKAAAQGFTSSPGALLTVSQVLASIQLAPVTATIGITGTVALTARGLDANAHYISGGSFSYASSNAAIATVGASTGIVTGVALGTDTVTATSGAITSNPSVITVSNAVPRLISFGHDTLSVGRGNSTQIPILLSTPDTSGAVIVKLTVRDTVAYWSTVAVTIPKGSTSINATLNGRNAGTTMAFATDSSGTGYAGDSAVVKVTANMSIATGTFYLNATDVANSQVLLSDPSPAGGTYVSYGYGTAGVASVSPDPAFIPAGQLAANIQITGLAAGTTTITPTAIGVNGTASNVTVYAPVLTLSSGYPTGTSVVGLGQYQPNYYVYLPTNTNVGVPVTLTSADTLVATVTPSVMIPSGTSYSYFTFNAVGLGSTTIVPSATAWTSRSTLTVIASTPHVGICCNNTIYTTSGIQYVTVYSEDSTGTSHYRTNSLIVNLRSSDTTVMRVIDSVVTINPGAYYTNGVRVTPGALGGTAYVVASAGGHTSDSALFTVNGPPLRFNWNSALVGRGQQDNNLYVYTPNNELAPLVVHLSNTDTTRVSVPDSVIIPTGTNYVYFSVLGLAPGTVTIGATATGYQSTTATYTVTSPQLYGCCGSTALNNFSGSYAITIYSTDTVGTSHYRTTPDTISVVSTNPAVVTVDSPTVIIAAGSYYNNTRRVTVVDTGTAQVVFSAPGQTARDTLTFTVVTPRIQFNFGTVLLGRRQHLDPNGNGFYVYTPNSRVDSVPVTLTQAHPTVDSLRTPSPLIPANTNYVYDDVYGLANGRDTLTVSATRYLSSTAYVVVSTPRLGSSNLPTSTTTTNPPIGLTVYAQDSTGTAHYTMDTLVVHAVSSDTTVLKPAQPFFRIPKNAYYASTSVNVVGPGAAYVVYSDSANSGYVPDTTNTMTVTGPSLHFSTTSTMLGMRQTSGSTGFYVYAPNAVTSPLVVHLLATDTMVATVVDSVIIPTGNNVAYFGVTARDTVGTIQIQATATGYGGATMTVQVTQPKFAISTATTLNTTSPRTGITIYAEDQNGTAHYTAENVVVTLASSAPTVANIDSATVTIPAGAYYVNTPTWAPNANQQTPGTAQLSATDTRAALYAYQQGTANVSVVTPSLEFNWGTQTLGIGQYNNQYVYAPNNAVSPIAVGLAHTGTARTSTTVSGAVVTTVTIPAATNSVYFHVVGSAVGWDTLVASAALPPFNPATGYTAVSQGHVDPIGGWPASLSLSTGDSALVTLYARDSTQTTHYVQDSTTFTLAPNANIQFVSGGVSSAVITSVVIPKDAYYVQFYVKGVSQGSGSATISATNYVTYNTPTITVSP